MVELSRLSKIVSVVQIEGVRLCEAHCRSAVQPSDTAEAIRVKTSRKALLAHGPGDDGSLRIEVTLALEVHSADEEEELQADVRGTFELTYQIPADETFSSEELEAFGQINAVFNAWPYWRELVHASLARMSMPILTVPVFRLSPDEAAEDRQGPEGDAEPERGEDVKRVEKEQDQNDD